MAVKRQTDGGWCGGRYDRRDEHGPVMTRKLVLDLSYLVTEALAFFIIGAVLSGASGREGASFWSYLAAEAGGFFLVRGLLRVDLPHGVLVVVGGVVTLALLVTLCGLAFEPGSFPPGWDGLVSFLRDPGRSSDAAWAALVYGIVLLTVAWGRGVMVAQRRIERSMALRSFSLGLVVLLFGLLFGQEQVTRGAINGASIPMVAFGLLTLALIHLRDGRPSAVDPWRGPWLVIVAGTIGVLVLAGAALGVLPLGPMGYVYDHAISPALEGLLFVVTWAIIIVAFPFAWLLSLLVSGIHPAAAPTPTPTTTQQDTTAQQQHQQTGAMAGVFVVLFKLIAILVVVAVTAYIAYRLFNRLHRPPDEDEDRDSLRGEGSVWGDLAALWRNLRPRRPSVFRGLDEPRLPAGVLEVRRLYVRLLERAASRGRERPASATPDEFGPLLEQDFNSPIPAHLTGAFVRARYGLVEPAPGEIDGLREGLKRLE